MFQNKVSRNLLILHLTVIVWGFTGILGALISVASYHLVWYRVFIAFISLFIYFKISKQPLYTDRALLLKLLLTGGLVGLHWILFFQSIKSSNVSITLVCMSSVTLFTAILEPLLNKRKIQSLELLIGLFIIFGIYLIFKFEARYVLGIALGLLCAVCASIFTIINSHLIKVSKAPLISFYEMIGAWLWISLFMLCSNKFDSTMALNLSDFLYLLILGTVCTSAAYVAGVSVMKELSAFRVALITNLEPIYGILLALIFFKQEEKMSVGFYAGALIVLGSVFLYPVLKSKLALKKLAKTLPPV
ncbi:DMT family transporter [Olivibacter sp. XZL3]|uniref:DMT family transporter n=1 Tax=Olivibacter sp. XZL3 TaxID=1735116 RepID=UPI0010656D98|nr:DMT family transporter [Olivibacter sp. XZL3]